HLGGLVAGSDLDSVLERQLDPLILVNDLRVADVAGANLLEHRGRVGLLEVAPAAPQLGDKQEQHDDAQDPQQWPTCKSLEIHPMRNPWRARPFPDHGLEPRAGPGAAASRRREI